MSEERQRGVDLFNEVWRLMGLERCEQNGIGDLDLAYAYEGLARAHALAGDGEADEWKSNARAAGEAIADPEDREHFDEDFATL
jgi:hypothetical protein